MKYLGGVGCRRAMCKGLSEFFDDYCTSDGTNNLCSGAGRWRKLGCWVRKNSGNPVVPKDTVDVSSVLRSTRNPQPGSNCWATTIEPQSKFRIRVQLL